LEAVQASQIEKSAKMTASKIGLKRFVLTTPGALIASTAIEAESLQTFSPPRYAAALKICASIRRKLRSRLTVASFQ
jgi:hypothetical protein